MLSFCSTSYLSVSDNAEFIHNIDIGIEKYGLNFGGSRRNNMCPDIYNLSEIFFSNFLGTEDTLLSSSGSLAGMLFSSYFIDKPECVIYQAIDVHPALKNPYGQYRAFQDFNILKEALTLLDPGIKKFIVLNSINPSTLNLLRREDLIKFERFENLTFVIDDSHGLGIINDEGRSYSLVFRELGLEYIILASLAKAHGIRGGIISGKKNIIDFLRNSPVWGGASPPPPFYFYAFLKSGEIYKDELLKLRSNIRYFRETVTDLNKFKFKDDFPVFIFRENIDADFLQKQGISISSFSYPTKNDPLIQRIVFNSSHRNDQIDRLVKVLKEIF